MDFHGIGDPTTVTNQLFRRCQEITNNSSRLSHLRGKVNGLMQGVGLSGCASPAGGLPGLPGPPSLPIIGIHEVNRWLFLDLMELVQYGTIIRIIIIIYTYKQDGAKVCER